MKTPAAFIVGSLLALVALQADATPGPAPVERDSPFRVRLALAKSRYLVHEEMPVAIAVTNTTPDPLAARLPDALRSLRLEIVDARSGRPLEAAVSFSKAEPGLGLRFFSEPGRSGGDRGVPAAPQAGAAKETGSESPAPGPRRAPAFSMAPDKAPLVTLPSGATAVTDCEMLFLYGRIPVGRYLLRAVYVTDDGLDVASPAVPFEVVPLPPAEEKAYAAYQLQQSSRSTRETVDLAEAFLRSFPNSIFADRVQRDALNSARLLRQWQKVVDLGIPVYSRPVWHGEHGATGAILAAGLWFTGRQQEARVIMSANAQADSLVTRLIQGEK